MIFCSTFASTLPPYISLSPTVPQQPTKSLRTWVLTGPFHYSCRSPLSYALPSLHRLSHSPSSRAHTPHPFSLPRFLFLFPFMSFRSHYHLLMHLSFPFIPHIALSPSPVLLSLFPFAFYVPPPANTPSHPPFYSSFLLAFILRPGSHDPLMMGHR